MHLYFINGQPVPLSGPFDVPALRRDIAKSDVVMLVDRNDPDHKTCVYGRALLRKVIESGKSVRVGVSSITIDFRPQYDDLEVVLAMVQVEKGRDEYQDGAA